MKFSILIFIFLSVCLNSNSQKNRAIAFYNVDNLFDTIDGINDDAEFLPGSKNDWNTAKYLEKLSHINQVFGELENPLLIGMCEIENALVLRDVISHTENLKNFSVVHHESKDARGIDAAMIYDSTTLTLVSSGYLRFVLPGQTDPSSRDIVWGKFACKKDTLIGMVNHWPSRRAGEDESEPNRLEAAKTARVFIDSLLKINPNYKIVFMGDLNDYPADKAPTMIKEKLSPMICSASGEFGGTYFYDNKWGILDHIFVSPGLTKKKGIKIVFDSGKILSFPYLLNEFKGNIVPFRTYGGSKYLGGYSDHLPVSIEVTVP